MVALVIALQYLQKAFDAVVAKDALRGTLTAQTAFLGAQTLETNVQYPSLRCDGSILSGLGAIEMVLSSDFWNGFFGKI